MFRSQPTSKHDEVIEITAVHIMPILSALSLTNDWQDGTTSGRRLYERNGLGSLACWS
jgi:hypothetical protein